MEEVRQLVQEEGREARNLIAFHVAVDTPAGRAPRKPPRGAPPPRRPPRTPARLRSASAGRDKRSELRARYWALLFGDLQRAVGEIYNTVEVHENPNECQEVILVLENYTRDFKALCEWFRLKWEYETTPPPMRPQSLAWEIRKTDFVRPESRRTHSVKSSPSVSGKNSPCLSGHNTPSGKNSPNLTGKASPGSGKVSPRLMHATSPKGTIEFFGSKSTKIASKPEAKVGKETRLSDIKEKDVKDVIEEANNTKEINLATEDNAAIVKEEIEAQKPSVEIGKAKECLNVAPKKVIVKSPKRAVGLEEKKIVNGQLSSQALATVDKLNAMESEFLAKQLIENAAKNENLLNQDLEVTKVLVTNDKSDEVTNDITISIDSIDQESVSTESPSKSDDNFADVSNESSKCEDKVPEIINTESKSNELTVSINKIKQNKKTDTKSTESLNYDDSMVKISNDCSIKDTKPKDISNSCILQDKPKDNTKSDIKDKVKTKTEMKINEKDCKPQPIKKEEVKDNKKPDETKDTKKDEIKFTEYKTQIEPKAIDLIKDEPKRLETKPIFELKPTSRPAYSQAAAKPKLIAVKTEVKTPAKTLARSKTVVDIRPYPPAKARTFANRNQKSKCSYPFNLTTGRTSLFDAGANKTPKKPVNEKPIKPQATQMAAGDNRIQTKTDLKNRPPRPMSLKINEKGDKEEKLNADFEKNKDNAYSSSETVVTQIDMSRIESSESLKTIVPENEHDITNSIEVLNIDGNKNDNEGWLTVKSRRLSRESKKSKSHWSNRFHQPSATTSLPTLNMIESPKSETNPIVTSQLDRAKSEQPQKPKETVIQVPIEPKPDKAKDMSMIRQKSDVTGLKTKSSRTKALKKDKKLKDSEEKLTKNRLHSSLESLTMGLARSQESTADAFDFDKWRSEFKSTFKYLEYDDQIQDDTEILKTADPSEMSEIAEMTSQIEENERKISLALDFQTEVDQRKLCEEEDLLNRQIMELQQVSDIDMDTETDDTETDAEILCEDSALESSCQSTDTLSSLSARLEDQYETALAGMSWAERVDTLGALEALVARDPGRAQQLHAKLSQGMRRRGSLQDALRRLQAKQARAQRQRSRLHAERARRIHQLLARVEEVKVAKNQLIDEKRIRMERRLQKAAENRDQHLKDIVRKAHDEEEKLREIAFIKQLEAENRRHEFLEQCRSHTTRLREMRRERLDKLEQKAAREAAVGARKKALEAARKQHVESMLEKRKERDARVEELKEQKKQERDDAAREKAEGVKSRLSALAAAAELEADALRSRIRDKQDASQLRLESHLQAIREKATTGQRQATTSESQEPDKNEDEEEAKAALEQEKKERERQKNMRKRARKMRQKLLPVMKVSREFETAARTALHNMIDQRSAKMHKLINHIFSLIRPFLPTPEADDHNEASKATNNNDEEKPKKKKKNKSRDRQLSACDSMSSSLSDKSRNGSKNTTPSVIDVAALEKLLNELHRMCACADTRATILKEERSIFTKVHAIKTLDLLLRFAVEREDLANQLHSRLLNTCTSIICKMMEACPLTACLWFTDPGIVHCVMLLQRQMEKDMLTDPREDNLTRTLAEAVSMGLNNVLHDTQKLSKDHLMLKRLRGHNIISFLCLSNVLSYPERCKESRKNIQTLLNVCGDVLLAVDGDGQERGVAQQNLRSVLGPDVFRMRNDFCMLFAEGAEIAHNDVFVNAARIAHVLRALGEIDHRIVQEAFGEGGWPLEFRAAIARLLSQHAPSDKEAPRKEPLRPGVIRLDAKVSLTFVLDLIELIGYVTVNNPPLRDTICDNWSVIKMLCNLPANWMVSPPNMHKLLPTLLVLAERPATAEVIASEISMQILQDYENSDVAQKVKTIQLLKLERKGVSGGKKTK